MCDRGRDSSALVPNCPDTSAPVWWRRNVLGPKCPGSEVSWHHYQQCLHHGCNLDVILYLTCCTADLHGSISSKQVRIFCEPQAIEPFTHRHWFTLRRRGTGPSDMSVTAPHTRSHNSCTNSVRSNVCITKLNHVYDLMIWSILSS